MRLKKGEKLAFIAMGVAALNMGLMASGIETMPGMWVKEVYENHVVGASLGGITGVGLGAMAGAAYVSTEEVVKKSISSIRDKFFKTSKESKLTI